MIDIPREPVVRTIPSRPRTVPASTSQPDSTPARRPHLAYADVIRIVGIGAVILGHVCDDIVFDLPVRGMTFEPISDAQWTYALVLDSLCRFAVPVFVMLSGALLLDPGRSTSAMEFYQRRLSRIGVPAIFWSLLFFALVARHDPSSGLGWRVALERLAAGEPAAHLHFIFRIAGLYLITPMLWVFLQHAPRRMVTGTVVICLALAMMDALIRPWLLETGVDSRTSASGTTFAAQFVPFLGYYLAGYLLRDMHLRRAGVALAGCGLAAGATVVVVGTIGLNQLFGQTTPNDPRSVLFLDLLNPARVLIAICSFLIFRSIFSHRWPDLPLYRFVAHRLAPATLGVYLVHPLMQGVLDKMGWSARSLGVWIGVPIATTIVCVASFAFSLAVSRIPILQWIVGTAPERPSRASGPGAGSLESTPRQTQRETSS